MIHNTNWKISNDFLSLISKKQKAQKLGVFLPMSNNKGLILVGFTTAKTGFSQREFHNGGMKN
uniref:ORF15 n=1 Tax=Nitrosopumilaceae spindle-shaped virus TaxID=3065433 RepID=A0AAT9J9N5_9VIRU